ncbi:MAG: zinc ribbon domain-containing protein [Pseudomonadota bacterium]|nr:zinc ribbon domain-containing protein [Pseudomonadota bacterium]
MSDCHSCKKPVPDGVKFCPNCGASLATETAKPDQGNVPFMKRKTHPVAWAIILPIVAISIWATFFHKDDPCGYDIAALTFVERVTKAQLKSPSTAEFEGPSAALITSSTCGVYQVWTKVHSQNGFGAMVVTPIAAKVRYKGDQKWEIISLELAGKVIKG